MPYWQTAESTANKKDSSKAIVVYFSRAGEQYKVGKVEQGNTAALAQMIVKKTGADVFEITPAEDNYPTDSYDALTEYAKKEQADNARPEISGDVENFKDYDTVFLGYPIWWGDMPMIVYSFIESHDFSGKTVIPFCTHEGSGNAGTKANNNAVYSCINYGEAFAPAEIAKQSICIDGDIAEVLNEIKA